MTDQNAFGSPAELRHRIGTNGAFSLNNVSGDVRIRGIDSDEVVVMATWDNGDQRRSLPLVVRRGPASLQIETEEQSGWFPFRDHGGIEFDVAVPRSARIDITVVSSDVEAHGVIGEQAYRTVSGDLVVDGTGGRISATTVSGDVNMTATKPAEVNVTTTSGDVEIYAERFEPVRLKTVSGDMTIRGRFAAGPQHTVESVSGDLSIETFSGLTVETKRGLDFSKPGSKRPLVAGDGSAQLRFRTLSGDVDLSGPRPGWTAGTRANWPADDAETHQHVVPGESQEAATDEDSLEILRALERGEIDVDEAARRLEGAASRG